MVSWLRVLDTCLPTFFSVAGVTLACADPSDTQHYLLFSIGNYWDFHLLVLNRVKTEFFGKLDSNRGIVNQINDQLDQYSSKLMDLRDALNDAVNKTRHAEDLNSLYRNHLEQTQVQEKKDAVLNDGI